MEVMRKAVRWKSGSLSVVKSEKAAQKWAASIMQKMKGAVAKVDE